LAGKDLAAELIFRLILLFFQVCLLLVSFIFLPFARQAHVRRQAQRVEELSQLARRLKLDFQGGQNPDVAKKYPYLDRLESVTEGSDHYSLNVFAGRYEGHPITIFEYHYATAGTWWWSPSWVIHNYISLFVLELNADFPELTIGAEGGGLFKAIGEIFGGGDIDFESHEFSEKFEVKSTSKKFAYDFCNVQMMTYLLERPIMLVEVEGGALSVGADGQHSESEIEISLRHLARMRSLMPNYLFKDGSGGKNYEQDNLGVPDDQGSEEDQDKMLDAEAEARKPRLTPEQQANLDRHLRHQRNERRGD
jgi:hypothetical protein